MPKELFIASSPHETKVAVVEDDSLVEVFYQRDTDAGLVGGIYKGRVSRVLPGMQSAFVDIGLERDAFLYVSDFFEDSDEYDRVVAEAETRVSKFTAESRPAEAPPPVPESPSEDAPEVSGGVQKVDRPDRPAAVTPPDAIPPAPETASVAAPVSAPSAPAEPRSAQPNRPWQDSPGGRGRRRRRGGRGGFGKPPLRDRDRDRDRDRPAAPQAPEAASEGFAILPGESLAKYSHEHVESEVPGTAGVVEAADASSPLENRSDEDVRESGVAVEFEAASAYRDAEERGAGEDDVKAPDEALASASPEVETEAAEGEPAEPAAATSSDADPFEDDLLAGNFRVAPLPVEPDAPSHHPAVRPAVRPVVRIEEEKETVEVAGLGASEEETVSAEVTEVIAYEEAGESEEVEGQDAAEEAETAEAEEALDPSFEEALRELPEDGSERPDPSVPSDEPAPTLEGNTAEAPGERSYTIRDQQQRPRFAPRRGRRGRGRFGNRGPRPEGQARRPDFPRAGNEQPVQINEVLKEGQEILVQIAKEPLGTKGARITSHIALPGRYLVYMPTIHHIGVSRKIGTEEERLRLRNIILEHRGPLGGGIIVRTAAAGRTEEELKGDIEFLARLWHEIRTRTERTKAPALIHRDLTLVERILRDILSPEFRSVRVDNEIEYQNVLDFVHRFQPALVGHVKLYTKDTPLFEGFGIQAEIDKALKPKVWLKSGGYIVINQTEALVAIDVNTGKYVGKTNRLEDTIVKTNIDAVKEIVRQVRLRDLGGIIVVDFIDMDDRRNRAKVVQALEEALRKDRAPTKILSFNEFGLVALTRKRVKQSLERTLSEQCPYCTGSGWIKSVTTVCYEIMEEVKKMAMEIEGDTLTLRVNPEVARALKSREGVLTSELESLTGKDVVIKSDSAVHQERFEIF
jgi:Rne/Rng family ribonuclease